jgi:hypothetical protein
MKKISVALLVSLFVAGTASAEVLGNGIVMTHDNDVAAQIEQHARDVQAQPPVVEHDQQAGDASTVRKPAHHHHKKHAAHANEGQASE